LTISLGFLLSLGFVVQPGQVQGQGTPFPKQKDLFEKLHVHEAWQLTKGSSDVLVGVIDNGFDFFHPDLKERLIPGFYAPGGYHTEVYENMAHGTLVASIIAAKGGQGSEMAGLAPECKVLTASTGTIEHKLLKLQKEFQKKSPKADAQEFLKEMVKHGDELKKFGQEWTSYQALSTAAAIRYLTDHGVKVINFSGLMKKSLIQSAEAWDKLQEAFQYASNKGVLVVIGAGNNAQACEDYPGDENSIIVVGATSEEFKAIYEVLPMGATSSATPIVTSLAALVYSLKPGLEAKSVIELIKKGCDDIGEKGFDIYTGYGRVNFLKTLQLAKEFTR
jgi:subtilisin family serine protease